ncbi:3'-5' exonuclease [Spirochaetia bacterium 38H-sp]|uniref:3'-5' exonuclease n=1 Tax=Rarispira pelagica TaxID=3141764 RepID=A0ABU9UAT5_9SPIR
MWFYVNIVIKTERKEMQFNWLESPVIAFDVETTGLYADKDRVVEIACVMFEDGREVDSLSSLINPGIPIPEVVSNIHGIYDDDVMDAPTMADFFDYFEDFVGNNVLVAHNAKFDLSFLRKEYARAGRDFPSLLILDTLSMSRKAFPGLPKYNLKALAYSCGIEQKYHHRALDDARTCGELFYKCIRQLAPSGELAIRGFSVG